MDILFLILMLIGVIMIVIAQVLKHKGMWDLRNDDVPFHYRRGIESPYELTSIGGILFALSIIGAIWNTFGIRAGLWSAAAAALISAVGNAVWFKHIEEDDKDPRTAAEVNIALSAFVLFVSGFWLFLI